MNEQRIGTFRTMLCALFFLALAAAPGALVADDVGTHALTGVRIVVAPGTVIESGTIVMRDGVLTAVGEEAEIPAGAKVWDHEGEKTVYAGLIEPYVPQAWPEINEEARPIGGHDNVLVRPEREIARHLDVEVFEKLRAAGYTTALIAPEGVLFSGRAALVHLGDGGVRANLLDPAAAHAAAFRTHPEGEYPNSLMGSVALFRQTLYDARWYEEAHASWKKNSAQRRPKWDSALESLVDVAGGRETILLETDDSLDTLRVAGLIEEFGLDARLLGHGSEYERLDEIAAKVKMHDVDYLLPLEFPDAPAVGEEDAMTVSLSDLRHWDQAPENPARVLAAGIDAAFTSYGLDPKGIHAALAQAIERGLTPEQALAAVTVTPAEMLGVGDRVGTIEAGKAANLVVVEGELFVEKPKIASVWVDGRRYEIKESKPPEVDPAGTWELTLDTGDDEETVLQLIFVGTVEDLSGTIGAGPLKLPLAEVTVSGKVVEFSFDGTPAGFPGSFTFRMTQKGERISGTGEGPPGEFTFTGRRTSKPEPEAGR